MESRVGESINVGEIKKENKRSREIEEQEKEEMK